MIAGADAAEDPSSSKPAGEEGPTPATATSASSTKLNPNAKEFSFSASAAVFTPGEWLHLQLLCLPGCIVARWTGRARVPGSDRPLVIRQPRAAQLRRWPAPLGKCRCTSTPDAVR